VDGCFWHGCPTHGNEPVTNSTYWQAKLTRNKERDARNSAALEARGWEVVRVWEHDDPNEAAARIEKLVRGRQARETSGAVARIWA